MEQKKFNVEDYAYIGTELFKFCDEPQPNGSTKKVMKRWTFAALERQYGQSNASLVNHYDGICYVPSHLNYQKTVGSFINMYDELAYKPQKGDCSHVLKLIQHIFGRQYELGLDYLKLIYEEPNRRLPILLLVSKEGNTGKTTFVNFLKKIYGSNMTFNTNDSFRSNFNMDWMGKLIIAVDEVLLDRKEDSERLKNLATAETFKFEAKGKEREEKKLFAKFILCSNNVDFPVFIDTNETRYWVRYVPVIENLDPDFMTKLVSEIPAFLQFLIEREKSTTESSRLWFSSEDLRTESLDNIKANCCPRTEKIVADLLLNIMDNNGADVVSCCPEDILSNFIQMGIHNIQTVDIRRVLKNTWGLVPSVPSSYETYAKNFNKDSGYELIKRKGRFYTVSRDVLKQYELS